jgi:hypothetical protein
LIALISGVDGPLFVRRTANCVAVAELFWYSSLRLELVVPPVPAAPVVPPRPAAPPLPATPVPPEPD